MQGKKKLNLDLDLDLSLSKQQQKPTVAQEAHAAPQAQAPPTEVQVDWEIKGMAQQGKINGETAGRMSWG